MKVELGPSRKKKKRKMKVRIDPWDTWNVDHTLAVIILPLLKTFKKNNHCYPGDWTQDFIDGEQRSFEGDGFDYPEDWGAKKWDKVLDKMIYSFTHIVNDNHITSMKKHERIQEGLDLFAKYYMALWD